MIFSSLFGRRETSAAKARERLQILLAHERAGGGSSDLLARLREDVLAVIARHVEIDPEKVQVSMTKQDDVSIIEIDVEVPDTSLPRLRVAGSR